MDCPDVPVRLVLGLPNDGIFRTLKLSARSSSRSLTMRYRKAFEQGHIHPVEARANHTDPTTRTRWNQTGIRNVDCVLSRVGAGRHHLGWIDIRAWVEPLGKRTCLGRTV